MKNYFFILFSTCLLFSCSNNTTQKDTNNGEYTDSASTLFSKIAPETSKITFKNKVVETMEFKIRVYTY